MFYFELHLIRYDPLINIKSAFILNAGEKWGINVTRHINATLGSDVTVSCTFTFPGKQTTKDVQVYWKLPVRSSFDIKELDKNAFIFHPNNTFVLEKYRGKTKLTGDKDEGSCSLMIQDINENEPNIYVRVIANDQKYSFKKEFVSIALHGKNFTKTFLMYYILE